MLTMLKKMLAKMVVIATALVSMHAFAADTPYDLTVEVSDKLFKNITSNQAKIKQEPNYLKTIVRAELMPYVHVKYAGSKVLGKILKPLHQNKEKNSLRRLSNISSKLMLKSLPCILIKN